MNHFSRYMVNFKFLDQKIETSPKTFNAWKVSLFGDFMVLIFPHLNWILKDTPYPFIFSANEGKYRPKILQIRPLFTQWFCKFNRATTQSLFFNLALFMMCDKHTMRLIQSGVSCQNPFWRFVSIYLFFEAKLKSLFRMTEVNVFDSTGKYNKCLRGGWIKFSGFPASPFLYANTVTPDFHTSGNLFAVQAVWRIFFRHQRRTGHFLTYSFPTHPFSDVFRG